MSGCGAWRGILDDARVMNSDEVDSTLCAYCRRPVEGGRACHLWKDGRAVTLCSSNCAEASLFGGAGPSGRAGDSDVMDEMVAERRWSCWGK